jgi:CBS domain-containing protein
MEMRMNVQSILAKKGSAVATIAQQATIQEAARRMNMANIGALIVTEGETVVGILTYRDIVRAVSSQGWRLSYLLVSEAMRTDFVAIAPEDSIKQVMALMITRRATHMPVMVGKRLAGIVSMGDVVEHRVEELEFETGVLRDAYIAVH